MGKTLKNYENFTKNSKKMIFEKRKQKNLTDAHKIRRRLEIAKVTHFKTISINPLKRRLSGFCF